jgi:apolipoprotein N-acyltransferase
VTRRDRKVLFGFEVALACGGFIFAVITAIWQDWIEIVFGVDPDEGSGSLEWLIVAVSLTVAVTCGVAARAQWQRLRLEQA